MAILNQKRILNLIPKTSAPVTIHVSQGDVGTEIEFTLVKGDELFVNTGSLTASVHGVREDGANFGAFTCTLSGSSVKFPLHSEMTMVKGSAIAEIVLVDSQGNKVGSANFGIMVEESVFPLGVTYDNDVSVYESILAYVQTIPAQVTQDYNTKINAETAARQAADLSLNNALANEVTNRTNAVSGEAATRAAADTFLQSQIDQIVAPSGEAPSVAEVENARVGVDGKIYSSLGQAIRTADSLMNPSLVALTGNKTQGYVNTSGGFNTGNPYWQHTDYIEIWGSKLIYKIVGGQGLSPNGYNIAFYDSLYVFISGVNQSANGEVLDIIDIPSNAKYVIISNLVAATWASSYVEFLGLKSKIAYDVLWGAIKELQDFDVVSKIPLTMTLLNGYVKSDGTIGGTSSTWRHTPPISLDGSKMFVYFKTPTSLNVSVGYNIAFFNASGTLISGEEFTNEVTFDNFVTVPSGTEYVMISANGTNDWASAFIIAANKKFQSSVVKVVAKDGSGDYQTVTEAVANSSSGDIILVKRGNYENEHIEAWGKQITIIGEDADSCVISCNDSTYDAPCCEFSCGALYNLTFKRLNAEGGGYALHSEDDYSYNKALYVENCKFYTPSTNAIGIGMRGGSDLTFKNCEFKTPNQGSTIYIHDSNDNSYIGINNILFDGCYFENTNNFIAQLQSQEKQGALINIKFNDCRFYGNGGSVAPYIAATNYFGGQSTDPDDFLGLINWRLVKSSSGNNMSNLNVLPTYTGINS